MAIGIQKAINNIFGSFTEATRSPSIRQMIKPELKEPNKMKLSKNSESDVNFYMMERAIKSAYNNIRSIYFQKNLINNKNIEQIKDKRGK